MQPFPTSTRSGRVTPPATSLVLHVALALLIAAGGYSLGRRVVDDPVTGPAVATAAPTAETGTPRTPDVDLDLGGTPASDAAENPSAFETDQFDPTWPPCSTVTVRLDASVPSTMADAVGNEARTVLLLAGHPVTEAAAVDLGLMVDPDVARLVTDGEIVIGFTTEGLLGEDVVGTSATRSDGTHALAGLVVIDSSLVGSDHFLPVLRHEMGHAVGLPHSDDPSALMHPTRLPGAPDSFQADELAALTAIATRPCEAAR